MELSEIRVFLLLAEELHFGRTAERAGLSQARVSQLVRRLESRLGGRLISRSNRTSTLTAFGQQFLDQIAQPFFALHSTFDALRERAVVPPLRLGMVAQSASGGPHLHEVLGEFVRAGRGRSVRTTRWRSRRDRRLATDCFS